MEESRSKKEHPQDGKPPRNKKQDWKVPICFLQSLNESILQKNCCPSLIKYLICEVTSSRLADPNISAKLTRQSLGSRRRRRMSRPESRMEVEEEEEMVCQHCDTPCWLKEDPCAMAEMKRRMEVEATVERDSLEAFFLRLLLLDNIKQEAQVDI